MKDKEIKGLRNWEDPDNYRDQTKTVTEKIMKQLEICSLAGSEIGMACIGALGKYGLPTWQGIDCKPADFMMMHINWSKYDNIYQKGKVFDNEYIYSLETMLQKMGYATTIMKYPGPLFFRYRLPANHACLIHFKGHFCCAIAWDFETEELIYHNPWPGDKRNKNNGRFERISVTDWEDRKILHALEFWK